MNKEASLVKKVTNSTKTTKSNLIIKGLTFEEAGQFKYLSKILNMKHHEFLSLLLTNFVESNPIVANRLTNQVVYLKAEIVEEPTIHDPEIERIMNDTRHLVEVKEIYKEGLEFRVSNLLLPYLKRKDIPGTQKQEVREFIRWARTQNLPSRHATLK